MLKLNQSSITHLSSINIQSHVMPIVSGHQVSPDVGSVPLVAVDSGGFHSSVCTKREVEACVSGASGLPSANAY